MKGRMLALELMDEGMLSARTFAEAAVQWLSDDEVLELLQRNDLIPDLDEDTE